MHHIQADELDNLITLINEEGQTLSSERSSAHEIRLHRSLLTYSLEIRSSQTWMRLDVNKNNDEKKRDSLTTRERNRTFTSSINRDSIGKQIFK